MTSILDLSFTFLTHCNHVYTQHTYRLVCMCVTIWLYFWLPFMHISVMNTQQELNTACHNRIGSNWRHRLCTLLYFYILWCYCHCCATLVNSQLVWVCKMCAIFHSDLYKQSSNHVRLIFMNMFPKVRSFIDGKWISHNTAWATLSFI